MEYEGDGDLLTTTTSSISTEALHLTQLDRVLQLRPSMHYLDGLDEMEAETKRLASKGGPVEEDADDADEDAKKATPVKKNQSISQSIKAGSGASGPGGPGMNGPFFDGNALMAPYRKAQGENWIELDWRDSKDLKYKDEVKEIVEKGLFASGRSELKCRTRPREYLP